MSNSDTCEECGLATAGCVCVDIDKAMSRAIMGSKLTKTSLVIGRFRPTLQPYDAEADAVELYRWHRHPSTVAASARRVRPPSLAHFEATFGKRDAHVLVSQAEDGRLLGCVRIGRDDEVSYVVAPEHRELGVASWMVPEAVREFGGSWCRIRRGNEASARVAERAGLRIEWL